MFTKAPMDGYASVNLDHEAKHVTEVVVDKENPVLKRFVLCHRRHSLPRSCRVKSYLENLEKINKGLFKEVLEQGKDDLDINNKTEYLDELSVDS